MPKYGPPARPALIPAATRSYRQPAKTDLMELTDARTSHFVAISMYLARRWSGSKRLSGYIEALWADYFKLDVGGRDHFVSQLTSDDDEQFWQKVWELQLGGHLLRLGHDTRSLKYGPGLISSRRLECWVEAVSPAPRGNSNGMVFLPLQGRRNPIQHAYWRNAAPLDSRLQTEEEEVRGLCSVWKHRGWRRLRGSRQWLPAFWVPPKRSWRVPDALGR
jgi:hypothetical protein